MADSFNLNDNSISAENKPPLKGLMQRALYALDENKTNTPQENKVEKRAIILENGVFMIKEDLETSTVKQDPKLKALVDSVLR
ncbi:MAG: hypothetical protein J6W60_00970 [Treponema sp.]|jgi:hypothetical protein|nr:hypothetical protein [Treponema sp.]MBR6152888.1 hypothetical protein [Treponema sp.]MBR7079296.1 hypothetical protein [Treponema sp.]